MARIVQPCGPRDAVEPLDPREVVAAIADGRRRHGEATAMACPQPRASSPSNRSRSSPGQAMKAMPSACAATSASVRSHSPFLDAHLAQAEQASTAGHSRRGRSGKRAGSARRQGRAGSRSAASARALARAVHPHHPGQRVAVGDAEAVHAELERAAAPARSRPTPRAGRRRGWSRQARRIGARAIVGGCGAVAEDQLLPREAAYIQASSAHPNSPWMNQSGAPPRPSPITPSRKIQ